MRPLRTSRPTHARHHISRPLRITSAALAVLAMTVTGCSSTDDGADGGTATADDPAPTTTADAATTGGDATVGDETGGDATVRPDGPSASFVELTGAPAVPPLAASSGPDLGAANWVETEYAASGTAVSYTAPEGLPFDGRFAFVPGESADYSTRVVVRRPVDGAAFNGTLVVEWLNVSSGNDAAPDYTYLSEELVREGYAWAGVSAQHIGIEGGAVAVAIAANPVAGKGLREQSPERYGTLAHPGDAFAYDLFTQVGRGLRAGGPTDGLDVEQVLAVGESQSAFALTTYANGVQPLTGQFDGFLLHSRGGSAMPLGEAGAGIPIAESMLGSPAQIRDDLDVPVFMVQTETDVLGVLNYLPARQEDTERVRLWEVAGTAHADSFQLGPVEEVLGCPLPINRGQQAYVLRAALRHLTRWVAGGEAPPVAERLGTDGEGMATRFATDVDGNATGGVRTPAVEAPVDTLSGMPAAASSLACLLMGTTTPLSPARVAELYPDREAYVTAYAEATDAAIDTGFVLREDREALIAESQPDQVG